MKGKESRQPGRRESDLFPTTVIGSMPRPAFVKDLIADDSPHSDDEFSGAKINDAASRTTAINSLIAASARSGSRALSAS